jgi:hypothetical protein
METIYKPGQEFLGKALVTCESKEGEFFFQAHYRVPTTMEDIQSRIDKNGGKVTGFRYTNVKVKSVQSRSWVATSAGF